MEYRVNSLGTKKGAPYLFLEGRYLLDAMFSPGKNYDIETSGNRLTLSIKDNGARVISQKNKSNSNKPYPVIDLNSKSLLSPFEGLSAVRVVIEPGRITLLPLASELKKRERFNRLKSKILENKNLDSAGLSFGLGLLSYALHDAFKKSGYGVDLKFCNEIREDLVDHAIESNPVLKERFNRLDTIKDTLTVIAPIQEIIQDEYLMSKVPKVDFMEAGIPCSGASSAGKTKNSLGIMEEHPHVGHLAHAALVMIEKTQPSILLIENVPEYQKTASMQIIRKQLSDMGYNLHEAIVNARDYECLESRERLFMLAVTPGLDFSFDKLIPSPTVLKPLSVHLEQVDEDSTLYRERTYLDEKQNRDIEKGNGFRRRFLTPDSIHVNTLRKGYHKGGTDDPQLKHPTSPEKSRLLRGSEHASIKGFSGEAYEILEGLSNTTQHEALGQAVARQPVIRVVACIVESLEKLKVLLESNPNISYREAEKMYAINLLASQTIDMEDDPVNRIDDTTPNLIPELNATLDSANGTSSLLDHPENDQTICDSLIVGTQRDLFGKTMNTGTLLNDERSLPIKGRKGYNVG